jgi:hypothetical protein
MSGLACACCVGRGDWGFGGDMGLLIVHILGEIVYEAYFDQRK